MLEFTGPQLDCSRIFEIVKARSAETVARNRGVNVRLFNDVASARSWLEETP